MVLHRIVSSVAGMPSYTTSYSVQILLPRVLRRLTLPRDINILIGVTFRKSINANYAKAPFFDEVSEFSPSFAQPPGRTHPIRLFNGALEPYG